ncbi:hypothetical protein MASR2M78_31570 [Treponema sp.]
MEIPVNNPDAELAILENLYESERKSSSLRQRELASAAGASLGMTNSILKRLAQKGLITASKLNSRNVQYAVTPAGINEIALRSYRYFKRTIRNVVFYRDRIDEAVSRAKGKGMQAVLLIGMSDLDFIVEHSCQRHGLSFLKAISPETAEPVRAYGVLSVFAENISSPERPNDQQEELYLSSILSGQRETP